MKNKKLREQVKSYIIVTLACVLYALSFDWFYAPNGFTVGGFTGISQIINFFAPILPVGTMVIVLNVPLFIVGLKKFGFAFLCKSIYTMTLSSILIDVVAAIHEFAPMDPLLTGSGPCQYFFSPYKGDKFLRQKLVAFLGTKGVKASSGEIQIISETNQALDFIVTLLVKPGDSVVMEEPVHPDMYRVMELAGAKILTVPVDENGMNCEVLESLLTQTRPRLIFVNSSYHDPTGNILSLERRKKIVELSNRYRVPIVEEDAASELVYDGDKLPPIKAFDTTGNVIYIYSFSLTFIPGLSLAFVTGNRDLIRALSYLVSVRLMASDWMTQKLLGMYLDDGIYYTSLLKFRDVYRTNRDLVCQKLDELAPLGVSYTKPRGGVYVWCRLPDGVDSKRFIRRAYNMGVTLIPGHVFYPCKNGGRDHIRINYSYESYERLGQGMDVLRKALEEELEE